MSGLLQVKLLDGMDNHGYMNQINFSMTSQSGFSTTAIEETLGVLTMITRIINTGSALDGLVVEVVGISFDARPLPGTIYLVQRIDETPFTYGNGEKWKVLPISASCLATWYLLSG